MLRPGLIFALVLAAAASLAAFTKSTIAVGQPAAIGFPGTLGPSAAVPAPGFRNEKPSFARRDFGSIHRVIAFSGPIQHVVLVYMENRTPDDLFGGYFTKPFPTGGTFGAALDLHAPSAVPTLQPNPLGAYFDPDHQHDPSFVDEAAGKYKLVAKQCGKAQCPPTANVFSYVPLPEPSPYVALIGHYAYANHVLQANAGPSYVAHQYSIAGQSGGLGDGVKSPFNISPYGQAENPRPVAAAAADLDDATGPADNVPVGNCFSGSTYSENSIDMLTAYPAIDGNPHPPCGDYTTILDEIATAYGPPTFADWQFVASRQNSIWAAPMAVEHLYSSYVSAPSKAGEPFAVDPDAVAFATNLVSATPTRPFAALTYLTPCLHESDHPITAGVNNAPAWLAYIVNTIGKSKYWPNTTIIVTWDDWGGFYDHYRPPGTFPVHPMPNPYNNPQDPNEWGFRVPLIVISPYVKSSGYISTNVRSQSAILNYVESTFNLPSLGADDRTNGSDNLGDMFDFSRSPMPYVPVTGGKQFNPKSFSCTGG
jgi:phospholipase C